MYGVWSHNGHLWENSLLKGKEKLGDLGRGGEERDKSIRQKIIIFFYEIKVTWWYIADHCNDPHMEIPEKDRHDLPFLQKTYQPNASLSLFLYVSLKLTYKEWKWSSKKIKQSLKCKQTIHLNSNQCDSGAGYEIDRKRQQVCSINT